MREVRDFSKAIGAVSVAVVFLIGSESLSAQHEHHSENIARPSLHPYVDPVGNRDQHLNTEALPNEFRVYDFYQRQADYYMSQPELPEVLPAFPGLDAGEHGHWGKHSQNDHSDGRWNEIDMGSVWGHTIRAGKTSVGKGVAVDLGEESGLAVCFDPETLSYPIVWQGDFLEFDPHRWGTSRGATVQGNVWIGAISETVTWNANETKYLGYYRHGSRVVFAYEIDGQQVLDLTGALGDGSEAVWTRTLQFVDGYDGGALSLGELPDGLSFGIESDQGEAWRRNADGSLEIPELARGAKLAIAVSRSKSEAAQGALAALTMEPQALVGGSAPRWPDILTAKGNLSEDNRPYVVDTIEIPENTGFASVMQLTSIGFLENGTALVASLPGEIWAVSGLDQDLENVTWKRFAAGLHQPIGLHVDHDGIFVMERGQITRLHDLNGDGEADFYENYANDFDAKNKSHTHAFGLVRDKEGAFYFANWKDIQRTSPEGKTDYFAFGVRNCMGVGSGANGGILFGPQEGSSTPASMVIDAKAGEFYGHLGGVSSSKDIALPLCFVPRGIDNSTGGFAYASDPRWGPINDHTIGLSYGYSTHYLVLRDDSGERAQGAVVPLEGDFQSGVMRGDFGPHDGQLYVTGIDGWGDYSVEDGCLQRIRYTGEPFRKPIGFRIHENGIRIDFPIVLDEAFASNPDNYFFQQWDYEYAQRYGSPEFSRKRPDTLGHDVIRIRSASLLDGGRSVFLEIPELEPVMQAHARMHLKGEDGVSFKTDLFPSIFELGEFFEGQGLAERVEGKMKTIALRLNYSESENELNTNSGELVEGERTIVLECNGSLQFDKKLLEAKPGEALRLVLKNSDVMPHNVVFTTEGNLKKVGEAAFAMLNDPKVMEKHYTPDLPEVIANTFIVQPGGTHTLRFRAPQAPGDHHFVCTFPGHWTVMNGIFRVR